MIKPKRTHWSVGLIFSGLLSVSFGMSFFAGPQERGSAWAILIIALVISVVVLVRRTLRG